MKKDWRVMVVHISLSERLLAQASEVSELRHADAWRGRRRRREGVLSGAEWSCFGVSCRLIEKKVFGPWWLVFLLDCT
mgnify:CR=1 FL=1